MIVFKDRAYCSDSTLCMTECDRRLTLELEEQALASGLPVCYAHMRGTDFCIGFEETTKGV